MRPLIRTMISLYKNSQLTGSPVHVNNSSTCEKTQIQGLVGQNSGHVSTVITVLNQDKTGVPTMPP